MEISGCILEGLPKVARFCVRASCANCRAAGSRWTVSISAIPGRSGPKSWDAAREPSGAMEKWGEKWGENGGDWTFLNRRVLFFWKPFDMIVGRVWKLERHPEIFPDLGSMNDPLTVSERLMCFFSIGFLGCELSFVPWATEHGVCNIVKAALITLSCYHSDGYPTCLVQSPAPKFRIFVGLKF